MDADDSHSGPDPARVATPADLVRELGLLRSRAARGTRSARVSLDDLASRVSEPKSTIHSYLTGKRLPPAQLLDRMVIALGSSPAELHEWAEAWYRVGAVRDATRRGLADGQARRKVPHQLPLPIDGFVGRANELLELDESVACSRPTRIALVSGTAGVGKTALAVRWAHGRADKFPGGQLYLDLRGFDPAEPMRPAHALVRLLHGLGASNSDTSMDVDELAALYRSELSGQRVLIMLDNGCDVEQVRPLLPGTSNCAVVITSRDSMAGLIARNGGHRVEVPLLPPNEAQQLLRALISEQSHGVSADPLELRPPESQVAALADRCCGLPLAIRLAAERATSRSSSSLGELVDELSDGHRELDLLEAGDDARSALRTVFSWSYRRLPAAAAATFRLTAVHPGTELTTHAIAAMTASELGQAQRSIELLTRAHLLAEHRPGRYSMHRLLRAYAAELVRATETERERGDALDRVNDYYLWTAVLAIRTVLPAPHPAGLESPETASWTTAFADTPAAGCWLDCEEANLGLAVELAGGDTADRQTAELARIVAEYLDRGPQLRVPRAALQDLPAVAGC